MFGHCALCGKWGTLREQKNFDKIRRLCKACRKSANRFEDAARTPEDNRAERAKRKWLASCAEIEITVSRQPQ
jgi:hypothetical protein